LDSVPTGRVIFEIGGAPIREELARDGTVLSLSLLRYTQLHLFYVTCPTALRQAADKLPTTYEFISRSSPPRLGRLLLPTTPSEPVKNLLLPSAPSEPASTPSI
jgi:hypothetical protein